MNSDKLWNKIEKLLKEVEEEGGKNLTKAQKKLIEKLMDALSGNIDKANIPSIISSVFDKFERDQVRPIVETIAREIINVTATINEYLALQVDSTSFLSTSEKVTGKILKSFGIEKSERSFKLIAGGYLDSLISNSSVRSNVQKIVMNSVFGQTSFSDTMKQLSSYVEGTPITEGALQRHFKTMAFDTMNIAARAQEDQIATEFDMQAFIYSGSVIENTRCFCTKNAGKVILVTEAVKEWPQILNETCGPRWDKNMQYKPLEHMGGHNCRHHKRYISNREALRRDSSLMMSGKELQRKS